MKPVAQSQLPLSLQGQSPIPFPLIKSQKQKAPPDSSSHIQSPQLSSIVEAQESERRRIARELHDEFGQQLTGLKFDIAWLRKRLASELPAAITEHLVGKADSILASVDGLMTSLRRTATSLHPSILDDLGLIPALESLVNDLSMRTGMACHLTIDQELSGFEPTVEAATALYRIVQELLTNVTKHAGATAVEIAMRTRESQICLNVTDNGKGIKPHHLRQAHSLGLRGIHERVFALDGTITITGMPDVGTTIQIKVPLASMTQSADCVRNISRKHAPNLGNLLDGNSRQGSCATTPTA